MTIVLYRNDWMEKSVPHSEAVRGPDTTDERGRDGGSTPTTGTITTTAIRSRNS